MDLERRAVSGRMAKWRRSTGARSRAKIALNSRHGLFRPDSVGDPCCSIWSAICSRVPRAGALLSEHLCPAGRRVQAFLAVFAS